MKIPGADCLRIEFHQHCSTEKRHDPLLIMDGSGRVLFSKSGRDWVDWATPLRIPGDEIRWSFTSDGSVNGWGWRFTVYAEMSAVDPVNRGSDRSILSRPCVELVIALLDKRLPQAEERGLISRLAAALASCSQLNIMSKLLKYSNNDRFRFLIRPLTAPP